MIKILKQPILIGALFILTTWLFYFIFTIPNVFESIPVIGSTNYLQTDSGIITENSHVFPSPFVDKNWLHWDAEHYNNIKENGYPKPNESWDGVYAFFPLFPFIWKLLHINGFGLSLFHSLIWLLSIQLLLNTLVPQQRQSETRFKFIFLFPSAFVFFMTYSEVWFLFFGSIGLYGFIKNKYLLTFIGIALMAAVRPAVTIAGMALFASVIPIIWQKESRTIYFKHFLFLISPLLLGTISALLFQSVTSNSMTTFFEVQKYWNHVLQFPSKLTDWSHEGFSISIWVLFFIGISAISICWNQFFKKGIEISKTAFIRRWCSIYFIGMISFILLFQGGSIHGMHRYVMATPFFYFWAIDGIISFKRSKAWQLFFIAFPLSIIAFFMSGYAKPIHFTESAFWLLTFLFFSFIFIKKDSQKPLKIMFLFLFIWAALWNCFLMNMFLSNTWITV